ncbi:hypothetical protein FH972_026569 [Carpinus fangiana]|uniref:Enoyl reductase (ER) domain-containing protein n=1 Tax=Carpinus fangiana TaxID=176857 RepID=A0A5N6L4U4_9ROSI|nr:hypothetical protein FH972_026569 [Carpinus fangiana]
MAPTQNKALIFKAVPSGWPVAGQDLTIEDRPIDLEKPLESGTLLVRNIYASFDPYQRGRMRSPEIKSYSPPFELGQPVTNRTLSRVINSANPKFSKGDLVVAIQGGNTEEYSIVPEKQISSGLLFKLDNPNKIDPIHFIGACGMPGLTAYSSFYAIGEPKKDETIFISAASGAVGQLVGQLAKKEGLKVIGSVGDDAKLDFIKKELNFDGGFNYKKEKASEALKRLAPQGIDIYYENVGGEQLEAAIGAMNPFGRIIACGMVSQYNLKPEESYGIKNLMQVVGKRLKMQGFIVGDANMGPVYAKEHMQNVSKWIADGTFKAQVSVTDGIDNAAEGFIGMLSGKNFGKAVLKISDLEQQHIMSDEKKPIDPTSPDSPPPSYTPNPNTQPPPEKAGPGPRRNGPPPPRPFDLPALVHLRASRTILASQSPRRAALLSTIGVRPEVKPSAFEENLDKTSLSPYELGLADRVVAEDDEGGGGMKLGYKDSGPSEGEVARAVAESSYGIGGGVRGEASGALGGAGGDGGAGHGRADDGGWHRVFTAVAVLMPLESLRAPGYALETHVEETGVRFDPMVSDEMILSYVRTREGVDKAGGYGIQGMGVLLIERIDGSWDNVVGMPLRATVRLVEKVLKMVKDDVEEDQEDILGEFGER